MEEELEVVLRAVDDASSTFESVAEAANEMGASMEEGALEGSEGFEDLESSAEAATGSIQDVIDYCNGIDGKGMQEAADAADNIEKETQEASDAVSNLSGELGIINSGMLLQTAEQIGNIGGKAEGMAQDMNEAAISVGQLATQTGIAEPQMVSLINEISNATFPNEEAMMYVKSLDQMGVASENLGKSATDLDRINDAFGLGAQTTNSLGQELGVLGVDMNNVSTAYNALAYANANTVGGMQNWFSFLRKYDAQFKELGYDVDQSSIIIAAATQKYGGGRAALSGLSSALEEADGDTRKLEEALDMQAGTLDNATAVTGQYEGQLMQLADEEAQHKTILDQLGAAWEDMSLSLSGVLSPMASMIGFVGQLGSFGMTIKGLKELGTSLKATKTFFTELNIVQSLHNAIEGEGAIAYMASALGITTEAAAAEGATVAFGGLAVAEGAVLWPILAIVAALALMAVAVYEVGKYFGWWTDVGSMIDAIWAGVQRLWSAFINHPDVQAMLGVMSQAWNILAAAVGKAISWVMSFFTANSNSKFDVVRALIDALGVAWKAMTLPIRLVITVVKLFMTTMKTVYNNVRTIINNIRNLWQRLPGLIRSAISSLVSIITAPFKNAYNGVVGAVDRIKSYVQGLTNISLSSITDKIVAPFRNAYNRVVQEVDKIKRKANELSGGLLGAIGLGFDYEGMLEELQSGRGTSYTTTSSEDININHQIDFLFDFRNLPEGTSEETLVRMLQSAITDKSVISQLVNSPDFQSLDGKVKNRIMLKNNRARGA